MFHAQQAMYIILQFADDSAKGFFFLFFSFLMLFMQDLCLKITCTELCTFPLVWWPGFFFFRTMYYSEKERKREEKKRKKKRKKEKKGREVLSCFDCESYMINEGFFFFPFFLCVLAEHFLPAWLEAHTWILCSFMLLQFAFQNKCISLWLA